MRETLPPPRHVNSNIFIWASGLEEGENFFAGVDEMREGITCPEEAALYRVRLYKVGDTPTVYRKVWWDESQVDTTIYLDEPEDDPEGEYIVHPMDFSDTYPSKSMEDIGGDWYYVDWMWREAKDPDVTYVEFEQDTYDKVLYERLEVPADPPYTEWTNESDDQNAQFECMVRLDRGVAFAQDVEVDDHIMCPQFRVMVEIENTYTNGCWSLYVVEHYFVEV